MDPLPRTDTAGLASGAVPHEHLGPSDGKCSRQSREGDRASPSSMSRPLRDKHPHAAMSQRIHQHMEHPLCLKTKHKSHDSSRNREGQRSPEKEPEGPGEGFPSRPRADHLQGLAHSSLTRCVQLVPPSNEGTDAPREEAACQRLYR